MVSDTTLSAYEFYVNKYGKDIDNSDKLFNSLQEMKLSPSYMKTIISSIVWKIKNETIPRPNKDALLQQYRYIISTLRCQVERDERNHTKTHGSIPKWDDIIARRDNEQNKKYHLLLSLYTYIPPRRLNDYVSLKVIDTKTDDTSMNYYTLDTHEMIFNIYKTSRTYGQQCFTVPQALHDIIFEYHKTNKSRTLLGVTDYHQIYYILNKLIGCSVDNLRHSYVNHYYKDYNVPSSDDLNDISQKMGHSVETNLLYRKVSK